MIVYAGAAQFLSVGLLGAKMGLAGIFMTVLFLNLRHALLGIGLGTACYVFLIQTRLLG